MDLSVVIVSYKNPDLLRKSLSSLHEHTRGLQAEIIVVDNDSGDGSADVARSYAGTIVEESGANLGFAGGVNRGLARARGRYVLILNPDIDVSPGSIQELLAFMDAHPRTGLAGPKLLNQDGTLQHSCRRFYTLKTILLRRTFLGKLFPGARALREHLMLDYDHQEPRVVDWVAGAAMMVRREAILDVGPMDDRYFLYFEDVDWCRRMHARGWDVHYVPGSVMTHEWQRASSGFSSTTGIHIRSGLKFYERWGVLAYLLQWYRQPLRVAGLMLVDAVAMVAAFLLAYLGRQLLAFWLEKPLWPLSFYVSFLTTSLAVFLATFASCGLYRQVRRGDWVDVAFDVAKGSTLAFLIVMASTFMLDLRGFSRVIVIGSWPIVMVLTFLNRRWITAVFHRVQQERFNLQRIAVLGEDPALRAMAQNLQEAGDSGYELVPVGLQEPEALARRLTEERVVAVMLSPGSFDGPEALQRAVQVLRRAGFQIHVADPYLNALPKQVTLEHVSGINWIRVERPAPVRFSKRLLDLVMGTLLAILGFVPALLQGFRGRFDWYRQLGKVFTGRMSLVGPRPGALEGHRPGITGAWSISPRSTPQEEVQQEMEYLEEWSVESDLKILARAFLRRMALVACLVATAASGAGAQTVLDDGMTPFLNAYEMRESVLDGNGSLWIASNGGALRYDLTSADWEVFPRLRFSGPAGNDLVTTDVGGDGLVWFGSGTRGVSTYDPASGRWAYFEEVPDDGTGVIETRVVRAPGDQVFIGTQAGMSLRFTANRVDVCNAVNDACGVPSYVINDYAKVGDSLWVATQEGLGLHDGTEWVDPEDLPQSASGLNAQSLAVQEEVLWLVVNDRVYSLQDTTLVDSGVNGHKLKRSSGELYLLNGITVFHLEGNAWSPLWTVDLPSGAGEVRDVDQVGGVLFATTDRGLVRRAVSGAEGALYPPGPEVPDFHYGLTVDSEGTVWVVNRQGLMAYDGESWSFLRRGENGLDNEWAFDVIAAGDELVVGHCCRDEPPRCSTDFGDGNTFEAVAAYDAWSLGYDGTRVWGGTNNNGVAVMGRSGQNQWVVLDEFTTDNSPLESNVVPALAADADEVWFGHQASGVTYWRHGGDAAGGVWNSIDTSNGLLDNSVSALLPASGGVWIGTSTGIHRTFGDVVLEARRTVLSGVPGDRPRAVRAIVVDELGNLWLGTGDGILVREVNQFEFRRYSTDNSSLPSNDIISGGLNPRDGSVWFGCVEGLVRVEPARVLDISLSNQDYIVAPNPFNPDRDRLSFLEMVSGNPETPTFDPSTLIDVLDASGKVVGEFTYAGGWTWDGRNANGQRVVPGLYIVRARPPGGEAVLVKLGVLR